MGRGSADVENLRLQRELAKHGAKGGPLQDRLEVAERRGREWEEAYRRQLRHSASCEEEITKLNGQLQELMETVKDLKEEKEREWGSSTVAYPIALVVQPAGEDEQSDDAEDREGTGDTVAELDHRLHTGIRGEQSVGACRP